MDLRTSTQPGHASGYDAARARWRSTADRLWPGVVADPDTYRRTAELVGALCERLRRTAGGPEELLAVEEDPAALLDGLAASRAHLEAACAIRADELEAGTP